MKRLRFEIQDLLSIQESIRILLWPSRKGTCCDQPLSVAFTALNLANITANERSQRKNAMDEKGAKT